jgi:hypothetical protein
VLIAISYLRPIYQSNKPAPVIILEDACEEGFGVIDSPPEDFEVSRKIIQRLAKFHAGSFFLVSENVRNFFQIFFNSKVINILF